MWVCEVGFEFDSGLLQSSDETSNQGSVSI